MSREIASGLLTQRQKDKLSNFFDSPRLVQPHQLAVFSGLSLDRSQKILEALKAEGVATGTKVVYHSCTDEPVWVLEGATTLFCPNCEEEIDPRTASTDSLVKTLDSILFV